MILPTFINKKLLDQAFTHRSYLNEAKEYLISNERLEFLGDSILSFVVSTHLYNKYPLKNEGILTNMRSLLVNTKSLGEVALSLNFGQKLKLSRGENEAKGRENLSLLADSYEAFIGALYLDQGIEVVSDFIEKTLLKRIDEVTAKKSLKDPKSLLQEHVQAKKLGQPQYTVVGEYGPAHARQFTVEVAVAGKILGTGSGRSKQEAEEISAKQALETMK